MHLAKLRPYVLALLVACGGANTGLKPGTFVVDGPTTIYVPAPLIQTDDGTLDRLGQAGVSIGCTSSKQPNQPHTVIFKCDKGMLVFAPNGMDPHYVTVACVGMDSQACQNWTTKIQQAEAKM